MPSSFDRHSDDEISRLESADEDIIDLILTDLSDETRVSTLMWSCESSPTSSSLPSPWHKHTQPITIGSDQSPFRLHGQDALMPMALSSFNGDHAKQMSEPDGSLALVTRSVSTEPADESTDSELDTEASVSTSDEVSTEESEESVQPAGDPSSDEEFVPSDVEKELRKRRPSSKIKVMTPPATPRINEAAAIPSSMPSSSRAVVLFEQFGRTRSQTRDGVKVEVMSNAVAPKVEVAPKAETASKVKAIKAEASFKVNEVIKTEAFNAKTAPNDEVVPKVEPSKTDCSNAKPALKASETVKAEASTAKASKALVLSQAERAIEAKEASKATMAIQSFSAADGAAADESADEADRALVTTGYEPQLKRRRVSPWTYDEDMLIVHLREKMSMSWVQIGREMRHSTHSVSAIQMHYLRTLRDRGAPFSEAEAKRFRSVLRRDWQTRWNRISQEMGPAYPADRCVRGALEELGLGAQNIAPAPVTFTVSGSRCDYEVAGDQSRLSDATLRFLKENGPQSDEAIVKLYTTPEL